MIFDLNDSEKSKLLSLLEQHEKNIDYLLFLQTFLWQKPRFSQEIPLENDPYKKRDFLFEEIEKIKPYPNTFVERDMKWDTQLLNADDFLANPYIKAINGLAFKKNDWCLENKTLNAYSLFPYQEEYHYASNYYLKMGLGFFDKDYSYPSLSLFDREWMSLNPFEIRTMETPIICARGKVLTLGLGLGYFAYMAHLKDEVKEVHIVEMDIELIKVFNEYLLPLFPYKEKIHIHKADAFYFVEDVKDGDYDFIFSDLWHDVGDGLPMYLKLKERLRNFKLTQCHYWIEGSLITRLRMLVIGIIRDELNQSECDYDELQLQIKEKLKNYRIANNYDLDDLLNIKGLDNLLFN